MTPPSPWAALAWVAAGSAAGGALRFLALGRMKAWGVSAPWGTLAVNGLGALALGALVGWLAGRAWWDDGWGRPLLAVGLLGGFTTFSAVAVEGLELLARRDWKLAGLYMLATMAGGLACAALGWRAGRALAG